MIYPSDRAIYPIDLLYKLDLCICTIPTVLREALRSQYLSISPFSSCHRTPSYSYCMGVSSRCQDDVEWVDRGIFWGLTIATPQCQWMCCTMALGSSTTSPYSPSPDPGEMPESNTMIPSGGTVPSTSSLVSSLPSPSPSVESTIGVDENGSSPPSHDGGGGGAGPYFIRSRTTSDLNGVTMTKYNTAPKNQMATTTTAITPRSYAQEGDNSWCIGGALSPDYYQLLMEECDYYPDGSDGNAVIHGLSWNDAYVATRLEQMDQLWIMDTMGYVRSAFDHGQRFHPPALMVGWSLRRHQWKSGHVVEPT